MTGKAMATLTIAQAMAIIDHSVQEALEHLGRYLWHVLERHQSKAVLAMRSTIGMTPAQVAKVRGDGDGPKPWSTNAPSRMYEAMRRIAEGIRQEGSARAASAGVDPHLTDVRLTRLGIMVVAMSKLEVGNYKGHGNDVPPAVMLVKAATALRRCLLAIVNCPDMIDVPDREGFVVQGMIDVDTPRKDLVDGSKAWVVRTGAIMEAWDALHNMAEVIDSEDPSDSHYAQANAARAYFAALIGLWPALVSPHLEVKRAPLAEAQDAMDGTARGDVEA